MTNIQLTNPAVDVDKAAAIQSIEALRVEVARRISRENDRDASFAIVTSRWRSTSNSAVEAIQAATAFLNNPDQMNKTTKADITAQLSALLSSVIETLQAMSSNMSSVATIGLADLPEAVKEPVHGTPPASLPPLTQPVDPSDVQVSQSQGVVVQPQPVEDPVVVSSDAPNTSNTTGTVPANQPNIDGTGTDAPPTPQPPLDQQQQQQTS